MQPHDQVQPTLPPAYGDVPLPTVEPPAYAPERLPTYSESLTGSGDAITTYEESLAYIPEDLQIREDLEDGSILYGRFLQIFQGSLAFFRSTQTLLEAHYRDGIAASTDVHELTASTHAVYRQVSRLINNYHIGRHLSILLKYQRRLSASRQLPLLCCVKNSTCLAVKRRLEIAANRKAFKKRRSEVIDKVAEIDCMTHQIWLSNAGYYSDSM